MPRRALLRVNLLKKGLSRLNPSAQKSAQTSVFGQKSAHVRSFPQKRAHMKSFPQRRAHMRSCAQTSKERCTQKREVGSIELHDSGSFDLKSVWLTLKVFGQSKKCPWWWLRVHVSLSLF